MCNLRPFLLAAYFIVLLLDCAYAQNGRNKGTVVQKSLNSNMTFTENKGQIVDMGGHLRSDVLYKGTSAGTDVYLRKTGMSYVRSNMGEVMHEIDEQVEEKEKTSLSRNGGNLNKIDADNLKQELMQKAQVKIHRLDVDFVGGNESPEVQPADQMGGYTNYYYTHCPQGVTNVNSYNEVTIKNIYNNIDVKYYSGTSLPHLGEAGGSGLKYDIVVNPRGDPGQIKLKYTGYKNIKLKNGNLFVETALGTMEETLPKVYQIINGEIINIKAGYKLTSSLPAGRQGLSEGHSVSEGGPQDVKSGDALITFQLGAWNHELPLIIDPFAWATYYGGSAYDYSSDISVDNGGNAMITGRTRSPALPIGATAGNIVFQGAYVFMDDAYVVKFNPAGARLWATYYGGNNDDCGSAITTDQANNIIITGFTSSGTLPMAATGGNTTFQAVYAGGTDAFVAKFASNGTLLWSTYYGGSLVEYGYGVATDLSGNVMITGFTKSPDLPVGAVAGNTILQTVYGGGNYDAFVVKFDVTGVRLWATYYGGSGLDEGLGITTDLSGNIAITGFTASPNLPVGAVVGNTVFQAANAGGVYDAFVAKFTPNGVRLWASYYGGSGLDTGKGITTDFSGNVIITGTADTGFPIGATAPNTVFQPVYGGSYDAFVVKFTPTGARLWSTYHGGNKIEGGQGVAIDKNGNIYITGEFEDDNNGTFPMNTCALQKTFGGGSPPEDFWVSKFSPTGKRICSTFIGGSGEDDFEGSYGNCIATWQNYVFITGNTKGGFPVTAGAFQPTHGGGTWDGVVAKFCGNSCGDNNSITVNVNTPASLCNNSALQFTSAVTSALTCDTNSYLYKWYFPGGAPSSSSQRNPNGIMYSSSGTYTVSLVVDAICGRDSVSQVIVITNSCGCTFSSPSVSSINPTCITANNGSAQVTISGGSGGPYTYSWSNGSSSITNSLTSQITNLTANTYSVTVTEGSCKSVTAVTITQPQAMAVLLSTQWSCPPNKASITASAFNGNSPFTYLWSNGQATQTATGLTPGSYSVTVTDKNGCTTSGTISISLLSTSITSTNINCSTSGSATVTATGGTIPYAYVWNIGQTGSATISCPTAGSYSVTVTDGSGCTSSKVVNITGTSPASATFTYTPACVGTPVNFTNTGTNPNSSECWFLPQLAVLNCTGANFSYTFLTAGTYSINHTVDAAGCQADLTSNIIVSDCSGLTVTATSTAVCTGSCATVISNPSRGTGPYAYSWSTGQTSQNINPCPVSTTAYSVKVTDSGGTTSISTATVTVNPGVSISVTATPGCGAINGSAFANPGGGTSPFIYNWSTGQSAQTATNLAPGNYAVTVVDSKGCTSTASTIIDPPLSAQYIKGTANCAGCGCKEWIMITATSGATPYNYLWPDGYSKRYQNKLCPGNYNINVTDKNGCSVSLIVTTP
jgi:hypothetical protein